MDTLPYRDLWWAILTSARCNANGRAVLPHGLDLDPPGYAGLPLLWRHNDNQEIGAVADIRADRDFAYVAFRLFDTYIADGLRAGLRFGVSPGYRTLECRYATAADRELYGLDTKIVITRWRPVEVTLTPDPANPAAWTLNSAAAIRGLPTEADVRAACRDAMHLARATR
jgi:hypothetical protein